MTGYNDIDITDGGGIRIEGFLPDPVPETMQVALRGFISTINQCRKLYAEMLADDDKLTGHERLNLIQLLDLALNHLVVVRSRISNKDRFDALVMKFNHHISIHIKGKKWTAQGELGRFRNLATKDFPLWLSRLQKERLPGLIKFLGLAMADGKLDAKEQLVLARSIDRSLFSILIVRESILSTMVD